MEFEKELEKCLRSILLLNAIENGWTVKKLSENEFMFKKDLDRYVLEDIEGNGSEFMNFLMGCSRNLLGPGDLCD